MRRISRQWAGGKVHCLDIGKEQVFWIIEFFQLLQIKWTSDLKFAHQNTLPRIIKGKTPSFWTFLTVSLIFLCYGNCIICQNAVLATSFSTPAISTKNVIFPIQGAQFWLKMSYFQPRGHNFDQICPINNPGGTILTKYVISWYDFGQIHHKIYFK